MQKFSDVFVPDYQQVQRYHKELLNRVRQERFARLSSESLNPWRGPFGRQLRLLLMNLRARKVTPVRSQTSGAHS